MRFALFAVLLFLSSAVQAGIHYQTADAGMLTYGAGLGVGKVQRVVLLANNDAAILIDKQATNSGPAFYFYDAFGTAVTPFTSINNLDWQDQSFLMERGDSVWVVPSYLNSTYQINPHKYLNGSLVTADTLGTGSASTSGGNRLGMAWMNNGTLIYYHDDENTPNGDSSYVFQTDAAFGSITSLTARGGQNALQGAGRRIPMSGIANVEAGVLIVDHNGLAGNGTDIRWADTTGFSLVQSNITGSIDLQTEGYLWAAVQGGPDSQLVWGWQSDVDGSNGLLIRAGHLSSGATGSPTSISYNSSAVQVVSAGSWGDTWAACPSFTFLRRDPDSIWCHYRDSNAGNVDIMRTFSEDRGVTWSTPVVEIAGAASDKRYWNIQFARWANIDDTCVYFAATYVDSMTTVNEHGYLYTDTIRFAGGGGGGGGGGATNRRGTGILNMQFLSSRPAYIGRPSIFNTEGN